MGIFTSANNIALKKLRKIADQVIALEPKYAPLSDDDLRAQTDVLKGRLNNGETLDQILPDAFAVCREAAWRVLKMKHFYSQILGGIALHQGRIAEMATGEGKTLVATLPSYLNALTGKGVHVVTVNEYLSRRDSEWMGKVHKFLGLSVGYVYGAMDFYSRKKAYACDITYATNNELGFDYLRDNMARAAEQRVQRGHNFAIVDEVDNILIDEARMPLIISGAGMKSSEMYHAAQRFVIGLKDEEDYHIELKEKRIHLTEEGTTKAERFFKVDNLADIECTELNHHIMNALQANYIMKRDENYIVKDDEILIVDEFTGRLMVGRRFSEGLHQAIEAKEGVKIQNENKTLATITFQNYFRLYKKLSGMTGTAKTEEAEFNGIYKLDVVTIPTNRPNIRIDEPDIVYTTMDAKFKAVAEEVEEVHATGRPILIGTVSIEKSELLSTYLRRKNIEHTVLNAKNHEQESEIIAQAGKKGKVTIATNMAGRGTDILLGGNAEALTKSRMRRENFSDEDIDIATSFIAKDLTPEQQYAKDTYQKYYAEYKAQTDAERAEVVALGGLHTIGTERHESRRIDNQLRGRAARQGDPGSSVFFISLEDDLMRRFGGEWLQKVAAFLKVDDDTPLQMRMLSKQIEKAQKRIENQNYAQRKTLIQFDDVINKQREIIYGDRNKIIDGEDVDKQITMMFPDQVTNIVRRYIDFNKPSFEWDLAALNTGLEDKLLPKGTNLVTPEFVDDCEPEELIEKIVKVLNARLDDRRAQFEIRGFNFADFERLILINNVDQKWMDHIDQMAIMKNEIILRQYGQQDPVVAYKNEGLELFDNMLNEIQEDTCMHALNANIGVNVHQTQQPIFRPINVVESGTTSGGTGEKSQARSDNTVGRNDLCPCGSGKKYKNCCGANQE